jgi:hypothetical protein
VKGLWTRAGVYLALILGVSLLAAGVLANNILPLYPITASVTVKNINTQQPVSGASVSAYFWGSLTGSGVTNSAGVATVNCPSNQGVQFVIIASGYEELDQTLIINVAGTATVYLTPSGTVPTYVTVRIYTVTAEGYKVRDVKIMGGAALAITNSEAYADVLCSSGAVTLTLDGSQATMKRINTWELMTFGSISVMVTASQNAVYTVFVPSGAIQSGAPDINNGGYAFMEFLFDEAIPGVPNWALLLGIVILLMLRK